MLADPARLGLWLFLGTLTMLFIGFTSAYMVRRVSSDWRQLSPPGLLWLNSAVLLASSVTVERARRRLRRWEPDVVRWLSATGILGALFVAGQVQAWRVLAARGALLAANPHNSFFYVLTGLHVLHLLGALVWFVVVLTKARRLAYTPGQDGLGLFATFWHFLDGLWIYLFLLLFVF
jgi:cytochrome c oxidase subunit 3